MASNTDFLAKPHVRNRLLPNETELLTQLILPVRPDLRRDITVTDIRPAPPGFAYTPVQLTYYFAWAILRFWSVDTINVFDQPVEFHDDGQTPNTKIVYSDAHVQGAPLISPPHAAYAAVRIYTLYKELPAPWHAKNFEVKKSGQRVGRVITTIDEQGPANAENVSFTTRTAFAITKKRTVVAPDTADADDADSSSLPSNETSTSNLSRRLCVLSINDVDQAEVPNLSFTQAIMTFFALTIRSTSTNSAYSVYRPLKRYWQVIRQAGQPTLYARFIISTPDQGRPILQLEDLAACLVEVLKSRSRPGPIVGFTADCSTPPGQSWMSVLITTVRPDPGPPGPAEAISITEA